MGHAHPPLHYNNRLKTLATYASVGVGIALITTKVIAWMMTGSVSILSSLTDSSLDLIASISTMIAVHHAIRPADSEHRFGHGKIEALSALAQSGVIALSVLFVLYEALERLFHPSPLHDPWVGIWTMLFSIGLLSALLVFQNRVIFKTKSIAITADAMHYKADLFLNLGVLISLFLSYFISLDWIDALVGAAIALYILYPSWEISKKAFDILVDRELPDATRQQILDCVSSHPEVFGCHNLKTCSFGNGEFIQIDLEMDGTLLLSEVHRISLEVEKNLLHLFPHAQIVIHQDIREHAEDHHAGFDR